MKRAAIALDLPGFGKSDRPTDFDYSIKSFAKLIEEIAEIKGYRNLIIIGHSLGGMIGTQLLYSSKVRVDCLISLEGNLNLEDCGSSREICALSESTFLEDYLPEMILKLSIKNTPSAASRLLALQAAAPQAIYLSSRSIVQESQSGSLLRAFTSSSCPKTLMIGSRSAFTSRGPFANAKVVEVPESGHFLLHDNYGFVAGEIAKGVDLFKLHS